MIIEINSETEGQDELEYPRLMIDEEDDIWLFIHEGEGVLIASESQGALGETAVGLFSFRDYKGSVTLRNGYEN